MNNFNYYEYINNYKDIELFNYKDAYEHFINNGRKENRVYNTNNLKDFNYNIYINNYTDLKNLTNDEAILHYIRYGKYENRTYKIDISDFNYNNYINNYTDIRNLNKDDALKHYINYGYNENRTYKINISDFNYFEYIYNYNDLIFMNEIEALNHYIKYGCKEGRIYNTKNIIDFDYNIYINNYDDLKILNEYEAKLHYIRYGRTENRIYNYKLENFNIIDNVFLDKINNIDYILWINLDISKDRFNYMSNILKNIKIPNIRISGIYDIDNISIINSNKSILEYNNNMNKYEIGCLLSHIKAINYINILDGKYFLILEDDAAFDNILLFKRNLNHIDLRYIISNAPSFDILILYKTYKKKLINDYTNWNDEFNNNNHIAGTVAYIINKDAVHKITNLINYDIENNKFKFNIDTISPSDYFIYSYCNAYVYKYNFINTMNKDSIIHKEHLEHHIEYSRIQRNIILDDII